MHFNRPELDLIIPLTEVEVASVVGGLYESFSDACRDAQAIAAVHHDTDPDWTFNMNGCSDDGLNDWTWTEDTVRKVVYIYSC